MKDRQPYPGKEGLMKHTPCDASGVPTGAPAYYAKVDMADSPLEIGTPFSKANILSDTTAARYFASVTGVETVDQVLAKLGAAALIDGTALTDMFGNAVGVRIATVSYTGTGTYGSSNPNVVALPFEPKLLMIFQSNGQPYFLIEYTGLTIGSTVNLTTSYQSNVLFNRIYDYEYINAKKSEDGKTIYWYHPKGATYQINDSGISFIVIAIG